MKRLNDDMAVFVTLGGTQLFHGDVVEAVAGAVAMAIGMRGDGDRLFRTQPGQDMELSYLAETGSYRHEVACRPGLLHFNVPIMPEEVTGRAARRRSPRRLEPTRTSLGLLAVFRTCRWSRFCIGRARHAGQGGPAGIRARR